MFNFKNFLKNDLNYIKEYLNINILNEKDIFQLIKESSDYCDEIIKSLRIHIIYVNAAFIAIFSAIIVLDAQNFKD